MTHARAIALLTALFFFIGSWGCTFDETTGDEEDAGDWQIEEDAGETGDTSEGNGDDGGDAREADADSGPDADRDTSQGPELYLGSEPPYETGELSVNRTSVSSAPAELLAFVPQGDDIYPVIVFQHGFLMANTHYGDLLEHIASHGFVVLAPQMYEAGGFPWDAPSIDDEAALATQIYDWIATDLESSINTAVEPDLLGLAGHSRGAKVIWTSLKDSPRDILGVSGVDPVDGTGGPGGTDDRILDSSVDFDVPSLLIGTGLGSESNDAFSPACAPEDDNYEQFFDAADSPAWQVVASDYGHLDMLDDDPSDCGLECGACVDGPSRAPMRQLTAGLLVSLFRATLQGDDGALDVLEDEDAAPVDVDMSVK